MNRKPGRAKVKPLQDLREEGVSKESAIRLHAALCRLVEGTFSTERCAGKLTVTDLAAEAEVSRATANRASAILAEMDRIAAEIDAGRAIPGNPVLRVKQLEREIEVLRRKHQRREQQLQRSIDVLAQRVQALELSCLHLQRIADTSTPGVTPIRESFPQA